jgi:peptide subunit release factor 1 (eRF1)
VTATHAVEASPLPAAPAAIRDILERLALLRAEFPGVVSLYVSLGVQDRIRSRYRIAVRDAIRRAAEAAEARHAPHPEREALRRDLERVGNHLDHQGDLPHTPGVVLFACEGLGLFEVVPLPRVLQTRLVLGERPRLTEAFAALEASDRILVAVVDRAHTRFFEVTPFEVRELSGLIQRTTRGGKFHSDREDSPGWGEHDFHNRIREERHRRAAGVADRLSELVGSGPCQGIVLAGPAKTTAEQERFLPRDLAARLLGTVRVNPTSVTAAEIGHAVLETRDAWARSHERQLMAELEQAVGTGWAVNGAGPTLKALARGSIRLLVVPAGQVGSGYRCGESGRLVLARGECAGEGEPVPVPDLVSEVLDEALRQRVEVEVIDDPEARAVVDGLAALLRFR